MWYSNLTSVACLLWLILFTSAHAAVVFDHARERLIGDRLQRDLAYGDMVWLEAGEEGETFPALMTYPRFGKEEHRAVILVHGMGGHPDWPDVISPLRAFMYENGYPTLSLQMPILSQTTPPADYGETIPAAIQRIGRGILFLKENGYTGVYIVGYGFGAATVAAYITDKDSSGVNAFVAISILAQKFLNPRPDIYRYLQSISIPVLDIFAEYDLKSIVETASARRKAAGKNKSSRYSQIEVTGARQSYSKSTDRLTAYIADWLRSVEFAARLNQVESGKRTTE